MKNLKSLISNFYTTHYYYIRGYSLLYLSLYILYYCNKIRLQYNLIQKLKLKLKPKPNSKNFNLLYYNNKLIIGGLTH